MRPNHGFCVCRGEVGGGGGENEISDALLN